jgi:hypothetical protein
MKPTYSALTTLLSIYIIIFKIFVGCADRNFFAFADVYGDEGGEGDEGEGEGDGMEKNDEEAKEEKGERREGQGAPKSKRQKQ